MDKFERRIYNKKYCESEKGKAAHKKYCESEKGESTHKKYHKKYRESEKGKVIHKKCHKKYRESKEGQKKIKVRDIFNNAVKRGDIIKEPCSICGDEKSEGHHNDYSKPLEVIWLCRKHHTDLHKN